MDKYFVGKKVLVRGNSSGIFYGTLEKKAGKEVILTRCRRIWYWDGAATLSQLAMEGTLKPEECKFTIYVDEIMITDIIEIIPCSDAAIESIEGVGEWKMIP